MNNEEKLINQFYNSFSRLDYREMQQCYCDDIIFSDPVFQQLKGKKAMAMWHMLCNASKGVSITVSDISANNESGSCKWKAKYTFSATGRAVHNKIQAQFKFKDGKISEHTDHFNLWRWSSMALGLPGLLLGWSPLIRNKVRHTAKRNLEKLIEKNEQYR
jgi:ketosteroid isomerase-like protein